MITFIHGQKWYFTLDEWALRLSKVCTCMCVCIYLYYGIRHYQWKIEVPVQSTLSPWRRSSAGVMGQWAHEWSATGSSSGIGCFGRSAACFLSCLSALSDVINYSRCRRNWLLIVLFDQDRINGSKLKRCKAALKILIVSSPIFETIYAIFVSSSLNIFTFTNASRCSSLPISSLQSSF